MPILTIDSARLNGTPSAGTVRITASRSPLMDSGSNTVYSGTQTFPLDAQGKLSVSLPATDSPSIGPFTYTVEANLASGQWIYRGVKLPANVATVDITDAQSASQNMYPTRQEWDAITAGMNTAIAGKVTGTGMSVRFDTTVGTRVFLDHPGGTTMLYGDTGWRDLRGSLLNGWTATLAVKIRRVNNLVTLAIAAGGASLNGSAATSNAFVSLPTGFVPDTGGNYGAVGFVWSDNTIALPIIKGFSELTLSARSRIDGVVTFPAVGSWPTSLPGTPL